MEEIKSSSRCLTANNRRDQNLLQSTGVVCGVCAWRSKGSNDDGAQIDLLIDRDDRVINLCEMKLCEGPFAVDREYDERLRERRATFLRQTGTRKAVHLTLVTTTGLAETKYRGVLQSVVTLADLF